MFGGTETKKETTFEDKNDLEHKISGIFLDLVDRFGTLPGAAWDYLLDNISFTDH